VIFSVEKQSSEPSKKSVKSRCLGRRRRRRNVCRRRKT